MCTLYELDLTAGYRAAQLANEVRSVRREARRWIKPLPAHSPAVDEFEGELVGEQQLEQLRDAIALLDDGQRAVLNTIAQEAHATVGSISAKVLPSRRRWLIARALVRWARHRVGRGHRGAPRLAHVTGNEQCHQPIVLLGAIVGRLTIDQATALGDMALAISDGHFSLTFDDAGTPCFAAV